MDDRRARLNSWRLGERKAAEVKSYFIGLAVLCTAGSAPPKQPLHTALMIKIESKMRLPAGSGTIDRFARAYKFASPTRVIALYFVPDDGKGKSFCSEAKKGGSKGEIALFCPPPDGMKVGERRWFSDNASLPVVFDGGCSYVDVEYDLKAETVIFSKCHGVA
ncbi:MAG: hypothetical protein ABIR08_04905 [Sphingomonas sp.]